MKPLPSPEENPNGLHAKYDVKKIYGNTDSDAFYFVLRLDSKEEEVPRHIYACRRAALLYAAIIDKGMPKLAAELREAVYGMIEAERDEDADPLQEIYIGGIYTHRKTKTVYVVTGIALDTDTGEKRVSYTKLGGDDRRFWSRPLEEFAGTVKEYHQDIRRFEFNRMCDWSNVDRMLPTEDTNQYQLGFDLEITFRSLQNREELFYFLEELDQFLIGIGLVDEAGSGNHKRWVSHISHRGGNFFDVSEAQLKQVTDWCNQHSSVSLTVASSLKNLWEEDSADSGE
jgi:hypothetical protein